jgi:CheY-like chemotaxis protein
LDQPLLGTTMQSYPSLHILLVEDDDVDAEIVQRALQGMKHTLWIARDGIEALQVLRGEAGHSPMPRPYLILLDLNLPRMNGIEFLQVLRRDPVLKDSTVIVLTTSDHKRDRTAAANAQVAGYFLKSHITDDLGQVITQLHLYQHRPSAT